jgi:ATP-dependent DNA helicase DinG
VPAGEVPQLRGLLLPARRREASSADIVVSNHHLLFSDLAVRRAQGNYSSPAVLPHYKRLVLDEAHNLEEAATSHLGPPCPAVACSGRCEAGAPGEGAAPGLSRRAWGGEERPARPAALDTIEERLLPSLEGARERAAAVFSFLNDVFNSGEPLARLDDHFAAHPVWPLGLDDALSGLLDNLQSMLAGMELLRERVATDDELRRQLEQQLMELRGAANRVQGAADGLRMASAPATSASRWCAGWSGRRRARTARVT